MRPVLFSLGWIDVYSYGTMLALAFGLGILLTRKEAKKQGLNPDLILDFSIYSLVAGIIGSRLVYVLLNWSRYIQNPIQILLIQEGGLAFHGGLLGGVLVGFYFCRKHKISFGNLADLISPSLLLGIGITRIGCFLNGCCYGYPSNNVWAVNFFDVPRHPTQIYEAMLCWGAFILLIKVRRRISFPGNTFLLALIFYSAIRFFVEFYRESVMTFEIISLAQLVSLAIIIVVSVLICYRGRIRKNDSIRWRFRNRSGI